MFTKSIRYLSCIILAPLFGLVGIFLGHLIFYPADKSTGEFVFTFLPISYAAAIIFGIPCLMLFLKWRWTKLWQFSVGGIFIGLLTLSVWMVPLAVADLREFFKLIISFEGLSLPTYAILAGLSAGISFWLILFRLGRYTT